MRPGATVPNAEADITGGLRLTCVSGTGETTCDALLAIDYGRSIAGPHSGTRRLRDHSRSRLCEDAAMPRFYFHIEDDSEIIDDLGTELSSNAAAKCEALRYASRLICDEAERYWDAGEFQMTVADENGLTLFSLALTLTAVDAPSIRMARRA